MPPSFMITLGHAPTASIPLRHCGNDLVVAVRVWPGAHHPADVVQHDGQVGDASGEVGQVGQLREEHRGFQDQAHVLQHARAGHVVVPLQAALNLPVFYLRMRVPAHRVADAAEPVGAGGLQRLQHGPHAVPQLQVGSADDGGGCAGVTVAAAGALVGDGLHELNLANGPHLLRPVGVRYSERASMNTVERTLWPLVMSASRSGSRYCW